MPYKGPRPKHKIKRKATLIMDKRKRKIQYIQGQKKFKKITRSPTGSMKRSIRYKQDNEASKKVCNQIMPTKKHKREIPKKKKHVCNRAQPHIYTHRIKNKEGVK